MDHTNLATFILFVKEVAGVTKISVASLLECMEKRVTIWLTIYCLT